MMNETINNIGNVYFPNLNLDFNINSVAFNIFNIDIYWYGIIITMGIILGLLIASYIAKKENMNPEIVTDFLMYDIVLAVIGARIYYVIFEWDQFDKDLLSILNIRGGGLAIYGGIITSIIVAVVYTRIKKVNFFQFADVSTYGLLAGQIIGRYGNFFNREAFGDYTNNLFAMRLLKSEAQNKAHLTKTILENVINVNGYEYIQVHPTFLYESSWNLIILFILLIYRRYRKSYGEIFSLYILFYGMGRFVIEGLRTDQLIIMGTNIAISQVVAIISVVLGISGFLLCRKNTRINWIDKKKKLIVDLFQNIAYTKIIEREWFLFWFYLEGLVMKKMETSIYLLQQNLNRLVDKWNRTEEDYNEIYKLSIALDKEIVKYYKDVASY